MADTGAYTPPGGGASVAVKIFMDPNKRVDGTGEQLISPRDEMGIICEGSFKPAAKARVIIDGAGDTYELAKFIELDGSISRWVVRRV